MSKRNNISQRHEGVSKDHASFPTWPQEGLHPPRCRPSDRDLVWHCSQCGLNEPAPELESPECSGRDQGGKLVRDTWITWAKEQPNPKPSWLIEWEDLNEPDKEVDRRIYDAISSLSAQRESSIEINRKISSKWKADLEELIAHQNLELLQLRNDSAKLVEKIREGVPEYPGKMPDEMWEAIRNDRDAATEALRITVRLTKQEVIDLIEALISTSAAESDEKASLAQRQPPKDVKI